MFTVIFLVAIELLIVFIAVEVLTHHIPESLQAASAENCCRLDGSTSPRRSRREHQARFKFRSDLWAGFLMIGLIGNGFLLFIHCYVMPLSLGAAIAAEFHRSAEVTRMRILDSRLDRDHARWYQRTHGGKRTEAEKVQRVLWALWPIFALMSVVIMVGGVIGIRAIHRRALLDYAEGLRVRNERNLIQDLSRFPD